MQYLEEFLPSSDGHEIPVRVWRPATVDKILVVAHGMAEYCERYAPLAEWLTQANIAVVALNHRGHGMDCADKDLGHFADHFGWTLVLEDLQRTVEFARQEMPNVPVTLFGHSMGSFIAQAYVQKYQNIDQLILCSTNRIDRAKLMVSLLMLSFIKFFKGPRGTSKLVDFLSFGIFNNKFKPVRTGSDWISRDIEHVDAYVADPYCGYSCTLLMWQDFINGMLSINPKNWPTALPVHFISGTADPVGEFSRGVTKLVNQAKAAGKNVASFKLYPGARHELVNETNAEEVWQDIRDIVLQG